MIGIGYRKEFAKSFMNPGPFPADFIEVAPENWIGIGGYWKRELMKVLAHYPLYTHGLSLSIGSPEPLDVEFVKQIKQFLDDTQAVLYSEHLSFSKVENAHTYDLLPIPFTQEAIDNVVRKIDQAQNLLGRTLVLENASYYTVLKEEMPEAEFISEIIKRSGCEMLLDINNVYVNAFNHQYDAKSFIKALPLQQVKYIHMAGHKKVSDDLIIDTHGMPIIDPVYDLLSTTFQLLEREVPVLLERDFNIPSLNELQEEMNTIKKLKNKALSSIPYEI